MILQMRWKNCWIAICSLAFLGFTATPANAASASTDEHLVVTGGVSLWEWEKDKPQPHDHWWLNFVRASRLRIEQLQQEYGPDARITWLVYAPAYRRRQLQEKKNLFPIIDSIRGKYGVRLIYFDTADQFCSYLNRGEDRSRCKIASLDYFGHSNRDCIMFDYSNEIGSSSKVWLHQLELSTKLQRGIFAKHALIKSWGCYQGQSFARFWDRATGAEMTGAVGRTQYMTEQLPVLSSPGGKWITN